VTEIRGQKSEVGSLLGTTERREKRERDQKPGGRRQPFDRLPETTLGTGRAGGQGAEGSEHHSLVIGGKCPS
jgi:hypothetical protein